MSLTVTRKSNRFYPDSKRVIAPFFMPDIKGNSDRAQSVIQKVISMSDDDVNLVLKQILRDFAKRHRNITKTFENHFDNIRSVVKKVNGGFPKGSRWEKSLSLKRKLLIGSYFTKEYSIESAAFFNPSIVEDPDQTDLEEGQKRIIVSFRATGEGHISSIVFRSGIIDKDNNLNFTQPGKLVDIPEVVKRHVYNKKTFLKKN